MNNTKRVLAAVALAGALFAVAAPAYADTSDGTTSEGHGAIESDVSYNALTQVLSFAVNPALLEAADRGGSE